MTSKIMPPLGPLGGVQLSVTKRTTVWVGYTTDRGISVG